MRPAFFLRPVPAGLCIALVCAVTFAGGMSAPFFFDDLGSIAENPHIRSLWPLSSALSAPDQATVDGRPLVALSLALNHHLGGLDVAGYHLFNLLVHIASACLLMGLLRRTLRTPRLETTCGRHADIVAFAAALLWAVHPLQTETVVYVVQRTELLAGGFYLALLYAVVRFRTDGPVGRWSAVAIVAAFAGMACKETMVTAPVVAWLFDAVFLTGPKSMRGTTNGHGVGTTAAPALAPQPPLSLGPALLQALRSAPWLYLGLFASWGLLATLIAAGPRNETVGFHLGVSAWESLLTQATVIPMYLRLAVWPHPLSVSYEWPIVSTLSAALPGALVVVALLAGTLWALVKRPVLGFCGAFFFIVLSPSSSFVPIVTEIAAERRMYLPLAAVVVLAVVGLQRLLVAVAQPRRRAGLATAGLVLAAGIPAFGSAVRVDDFASVETIWRDVIAKQPDNAYARFELCVELKRQQRYEEALEEVLLSIELEPRHFGSRVALGDVLFNLGAVEDAIAAYQVPLGMDRADAPLHHNLGLALAHAGRIDEAVTRFREALQFDPDYADAHVNLGVLLLHQGDPLAARDEARAALAVAPKHDKALALLTRAQLGLTGSPASAGD